MSQTPNVASIKPITSQPTPTRWPRLLILLLPLTLFYIGFGFFLLVSGHTILLTDFVRRWREEQYVIAGKDPYDILFTRDQSRHNPFPPVEFRSVTVDPAVGWLDTVGYPPWTYFTGFALHSAPLPWGRFQFVAANLLALIALGSWAVGEAPPSSTLAEKSFLPLCFLATMPFFITLWYGQYGIILLALLAWAARLSGTRRWWLSGLLMGMAMLKPTMAVAFFALPLCARRWREIIIAAIYTAIGGLTICQMTKTSPVLFLSEMQADATRYVIETGSLLKAVYKLGVPLKFAVPGLMIALSLVEYLWLRALGRRATILDQLAIAGFVARIFTYHRPYDDLLLTFLLVALVVRLIQSPTKSLLAAMLLVGFSLWFPFGAYWRWPALALQHICWFAGVAALTADILARRRSAAQAPITFDDSLKAT